MTGSTGTTGAEFPPQPPLSASARTVGYGNLVRVGPASARDAAARGWPRRCPTANDRVIGQQFFELLGARLGLQQQRWQVFVGLLEISGDSRHQLCSSAEVARNTARIGEDLIDLPQQRREYALAIAGDVNQRGGN